MDEKLKKVIDLANQLQKAVLDCDGVLCVSIDGDCPNRINTGIQLWEIQNRGIDGLELYREDGDRWFNSKLYGVNIFGSAIGGDNQ